jgi:protein-L-isoaspartate(D-aspartate) O-methyltransferase
MAPRGGGIEKGCATMFRVWNRLALVILLGCSSLALAQPTSDDRSVERNEMVRVVELETFFLSGETGIRELAPGVREALREVPRHAFVPEPLQAYAYGNHPLPVGYDQNIAAPLLVALMTHLIEPEADDIVFETGTGAGYHAAILSRLVDRVYSVEVVEPLAEQAGRVLKEQGYDNVFTKAGDGYYGWPEHAPYDAVVIKEALDHVPPTLLAQLKVGGKMVLPLGPAPGPQELTVITKTGNGEFSERRIMPVRFSPLQGGERL